MTFFVIVSCFSLCFFENFASLCCPQVVSFFNRAMLTLGLGVLSLWPILTGLFTKAKVAQQHILLLQSQKNIYIYIYKI